MVRRTEGPLLGRVALTRFCVRVHISAYEPTMSLIPRERLDVRNTLPLFGGELNRPENCPSGPRDPERSEPVFARLTWKDRRSRYIVL